MGRLRREAIELFPPGRQESVGRMQSLLLGLPECCRWVLPPCLVGGCRLSKGGWLVFFSWGKETDVNGKAGEKRWSSLVWLCSNECVVMCLYLPNK